MVCKLLTQKVPRIAVAHVELGDEEKSMAGDQSLYIEDQPGLDHRRNSYTKAVQMDDIL